jgi:hypothetical protein
MANTLGVLISNMLDKQVTSPAKAASAADVIQAEGEKNSKHSAITKTGLHPGFEHEIKEFMTHFGKVVSDQMLVEINNFLATSFGGVRENNIPEKPNEICARFSAFVAKEALMTLVLKTKIPSLFAAQSRTWKTRQAAKKPRGGVFYKRKIREILASDNSLNKSSVIIKLEKGGWIKLNSDTGDWQVADDESIRMKSKEVKTATIESAIATIRNQVTGKRK